MNIPPNKYVAQAIPEESALAESSTGTPCVAVRFQIIEPHEQFGERITWYGYLSEKAQARTIESLRIAGFKGDDLTDLSSLGSDQCEIDVQNETYEGKVQTRVKWVNRIGGSGVAVKGVMDDAKRKAFAASLRGAFRAFDATNGKPPTKPSAPRGGPSSSDVPF